jgi:hypothetical protein
MIPSLTLGAGCDKVRRVPQFSSSCCDDESSWVAPQKIALPFGQLEKQNIKWFLIIWKIFFINLFY